MNIEDGTSIAAVGDDIELRSGNDFHLAPTASCGPSTPSPSAATRRTPTPPAPPCSSRAAVRAVLIEVFGHSRRRLHQLQPGGDHRPHRDLGRRRRRLHPPRPAARPSTSADKTTAAAPGRPRSSPGAGADPPPGHASTSTARAAPTSSRSTPTGTTDYIVNVTDTGADDDGADLLRINGTATPDVFLLREFFVARLQRTVSAAPADFAAPTSASTTTAPSTSCTSSPARATAPTTTTTSSTSTTTAAITVLDGGDGDDYLPVRPDVRRRPDRTRPGRPRRRDRDRRDDRRLPDPGHQLLHRRLRRRRRRPHDASTPTRRCSSCSARPATTSSWSAPSSSRAPARSPPATPILNGGERRRPDRVQHQRPGRHRRRRRRRHRRHHRHRGRRQLRHHPGRRHGRRPQRELRRASRSSRSTAWRATTTSTSSAPTRRSSPRSSAAWAATPSTSAATWSPPIIALSVEGVSGFINHTASSADPAYNGIFVDGRLAERGRGQRAGAGGARPAAARPCRGRRGGEHRHLHAEARGAAPVDGTKIYITVAAAPAPSKDAGRLGGKSAQVSLDGVNFYDFLVVVFDAGRGRRSAATAWARTQTVYVRAVGDTAARGRAHRRRQPLELQHQRRLRPPEHRQRRGPGHRRRQARPGRPAERRSTRRWSRASPPTTYTVRAHHGRPIAGEIVTVDARASTRPRSTLTSADARASHAAHRTTSPPDLRRRRLEHRRARSRVTALDDTVGREPDAPHDRPHDDELRRRPDYGAWPRSPRSTSTSATTTPAACW